MENIQHFKDLLEEEKLKIEGELRSIGRPSDTNPADWEIKESGEGEEAEEGDIAENIEKQEDDNAVINQLEKQLVDVRSALSKIENGTYGVCEVGGEAIELDRLEANPSAKTCKTHMNS
ncbi:MAG TPA: TraR/DksA C4-type zinc finger protein [Candidatus Paceibacterota bacterium]|nr:RNA polymerase-binding transcription factor DksA [uncultured archaeon]